MIETFFKLINSRDLEKMKDFLHPNAKFYFPKAKPLIGRDRILLFFKILFHQYPELTFEIQRVIRNGDKVAVHWTNHGTNRNKGSYENEGVTILEMKNNKITFMSDFFKDTEKF